jgi:hypothetical protein
LIVSFFALLFIWFQSPKIRKEKKNHTWGVSNLGLIRENLTMEEWSPPLSPPQTTTTSTCNSKNSVSNVKCWSGMWWKGTREWIYWNETLNPNTYEFKMKV